MVGDIFYSQVLEEVRTEIDARAQSGKTRYTNDLNFQLGKIANVELIAYEGTVAEEKSPLTTERFGVLGGKIVRSGEYLPSTMDGFLTKTSKRIPPTISSVLVDISDHSFGLLNKASVTFMLHNIDDFDQFESIWMRPGRFAKILIQYPETAVLSNNTYDIQPTAENGRLIPKENDKLNKAEFECTITSFSITYNADATISIVVDFIGKSAVYTDVSMIQSFSSGSKNEDEAEDAGILDANVNNTIYGDISSQIRQQKRTLNSPKNGYIAGFLWGQLYPNDINDTTNENNNELVYDYISLGQLIRIVNTRLLGAYGRSNIQYITTNKYLTSDDEVYSEMGLINSTFQSIYYTAPTTYYPELVSVDPTRVLLWSGDTDSKTSTYINPSTGEGVKVLSDVQIFDSSDSSFEKDGRCSIENIYISLDIIKKLISDKINDSGYLIKDFILQIADEISWNTAGAIKLGLIPHPDSSEYLLLYDTAYTGDVELKSNVEPYIIPMFANDYRGTAVLDISMQSKLPSSLKNLAFALNESVDITTANIAPHIQYMYASEDERERIVQSFEKKHKDAVARLSVAKGSISNDLSNVTKQTELYSAIKGYIKHPNPSIEASNWLQSPIYPFEITVTLDGINGFRYGDVLNFNGLPSRYTTHTVFSIIKISHEVSSDGKWVTKLTCIMRPKVRV